MNRRGVDNAIQATVVIASGEHLTVNSYSHSDLWWAYGVITSVKYRTYPTVPLIAAVFANMVDPVTAKNLVAEFIRILPALANSGWSGHGYITPRNTFSFWYLLPSSSSVQANTAIGSFLHFARNLTSEGLIVDTAYTKKYDSFYDWYIELYATDGGVGHNTEIASRLLPPEAFDDHEAAAEAFLNGYVNSMLAGRLISQVGPAAMNPAWRKALVHAVVGAGWPDDTSSVEIEYIKQDLQRPLAKLTALAPDSGCYFNEASLHESNPTWALFGSHYAALRAIKKLYDSLVTRLVI